MKKLSLLLFIIYYALFISISFGQKQGNISIKGKIINNPFKTIYIDKYDKETLVIDSAKINNEGTFILNTSIKETGFYNLRLNEEKTLILILSPGEKVNLSADYTNFQTPISISGSEQSVLTFDLSKKLTIYDKKKDSLNKIYENSTDKETIVNQLRIAFDKFSEEQRQLMRNCILNNLNLLTGLLFINKLDIGNNIDVYTKYDSVINKKYPQNNFVKEFHKQVVKNRAVLTGKIAPDIIEKDTSGIVHALSSLRGKYVLIDFWASWCGPCRRESPNVVKLYKKFHDKGFEIFSVSLDKDKESWKNAIKRDNLTWTQVSDLGFWTSAPAQLYNVTSIPYMVLIDKKGKILAKVNSASQIDERLSQLLK